jgi:hypothetical protein
MDGTPGARFSSKLDKCRLIEFLHNLGYSLSNCKYFILLETAVNAVISKLLAWPVVPG